MSYFNAVQYVTSGLGLMAFLGALIALILRTRIKSTERVVSRARPEDLPEIVRNLLDSLQVPLLEIPEKRRAEIALEMLRLRSKRFTRLMLAGIVVAIIAAATYLFSRPLPAQASTSLSQEERDVVDTKEQVVELRGDFEALAKYPNQRSAVMKRALGLADIMFTVPDGKLSLGHRILKHQYGTFALTLAAAAAFQDNTRRPLAQRAMVEGTESIDLYNSTQALSRNGNREAMDAFKWLVNDDGMNRTRYLIAWATAIEAKADGNSKPSDAIRALKEIDCSYLERFPPNADAELGWALKASGDDMAACRG